MRATIVLGVVLALAAPSAFAGAVTGTFNYESRDYDDTGFTGGTTLLPVRQAEVELLDVDNGDAVIGTGTTNDAGAFSIAPTVGGVRNVRARAYARRQSGIFDAQILNDTTNNAVYTGLTATVSIDLGVGGALGTTDFTIGASPDTAEAMNIFDCAVWVFQHIDALNTLAGTTSPSPLPGIRLYWETGSNGTFYDPVPQRIFLLGRASDDDGYDDDIVLHELGHFVMAEWSRDDTPGGFHTITSLLDPRLAWSEGAATWWSSATRAHANSVTPGLYGNPESHVDNFGTGASVYNIETPSFSADTITARNEVACAASVWDTLDAADEAQDVLPDAGNPDTRDDIWAVLRTYIPTLASTPITLEDYFLGWENRVGIGDPQVVMLSGDLATTRIMNHRQIGYFEDINDDGGVTNNTSGTATGPLVPDFVVTDLTFFNEASPHIGDEDWFLLMLPTGAVQIETENLRDACDTVLEFYDAALVLLATHDNVSPADPSSIITFTIGTAGPYFVRARPFAGAGQIVELGQYDLRVTMLANIPPSVSLAASATSGTAPLVVTFAATASDSDGYVALWEYDFNGDGEYDEYEYRELEGSSVTHMFDTPGTFLVAVRVTDDGGFDNEDFISIVVSAPASPTIDVSVSLSSVSAPSTITLDATISGITPAGYEWDVDGNGTIDRVSTITPLVAVLFTVPGDYAARLYVTDVNGVRYVSDNKAFSIGPSPGPPTGSLSAVPSSGTVPLNVTLTAGVLPTPPATTIVRYEWDLDGDGQVDRETTGNSITPTFTRVGTYTVRVRAVDDVNQGQEFTDTVTLTGPAADTGWLVTPPAVSIDGDAIATVLEAMPNDAPKTIEFQSAPALPGPYTTYATVTTSRPRAEAAFDATPVPNLAVRFLRATINGTPTATVAVVRDTGTQAVLENTTAAGIDKEQDVTVTDTVSVWLNDGASATFPARCSASATDIRVSFRNLGASGGGGSAFGGDAYEVDVIVGSTTFQNHYWLTIPYPDADDDGIVDGTSVPVDTLQIRVWNGASWAPLFGSTVLRNERRVRGRIAGVGTFGVFSTRPGPGTTARDTEGSDGFRRQTCFFFASGRADGRAVAALILVLAIAALRRTA